MIGPVADRGICFSEDPDSPTGLANLNDEEFQAHLLEGVSRTFALTIPQLPSELRFVVSNAYLLCRIVDTIEDEPALKAKEKRDYCERFVRVVAGNDGAEAFADDLFPLLSEETIPEERELIQVTPRVIRISCEFDREVREILGNCIRIMANGMAHFQSGGCEDGLLDLSEMDRYCYFVAGVVGEMLTRLFCHYSEETAKNRDVMMKLAVSFGQGLQMTNILKDIWDDKKRSACWLPRDVFSREGIELRDLESVHGSEGFSRGLECLIGVAHGHLNKALTYTLLVPKRETGIRKFCIWNIGMAVLTLRNINTNRAFAHGNEVKISRRSVKATILATQITVTSDTLLKSLFYLAGMRLPHADPEKNRHF